MPPPITGLLTEDEKVQIRHHTGYVNVGEMQTFVLGVPAGLETQYLIDGAMKRVLPAALPLIRRHLVILSGIEEQKVCDLELTAVNQLDSISINQGEQSALDKQYDYWVDSLCNALGVMRNPFDKRKFERPGGINVRVG